MWFLYRDIEYLMIFFVVCCPGNASRFCSSDFSWGSVDASQCQSVIFTDIIDRVRGVVGVVVSLGGGGGGGGKGGYCL